MLHILYYLYIYYINKDSLEVSPRRIVQILQVCAQIFRKSSKVLIVKISLPQSIAAAGICETVYAFLLQQCALFNDFSLWTYCSSIQLEHSSFWPHTPLIL